MVVISLLGIIGFVIFIVRKFYLIKGHLFFNAVRIMLFISDTEYFVL